MVGRNSLTIRICLLGATSVLALAMLAACRGPSQRSVDDSGATAADDDGLTTIRLTGTVADTAWAQASGAAGRSAPRTAAASVTHVAAIPLTGPTIDRSSIANQEEFPVDEQGNFDISLARDHPWVFVLKNNNAVDLRDSFVSFVSIPDTQQSLVFIPIDEALSDVDLGELYNVGDEYQSVHTVSDLSSSFDLPLADLQLLARYDNIMKYVKNYCMNYDPETGTLYDLAVSVWYSNRDPIQKDAYIAPELYHRERYLLWIALENVAGLWSADLESGLTRLALVPPEGSTVLDQSGTPYTAVFPPTTDGDRTASQYYDSVDYWCAGGLSFRVSSAADVVTSLCFWLTGDMATGLWTLERDGAVIAVFDLTDTKETDQSGHFTVFVPSMQFQFRADGVLEAIEIKFLSYDDTAGGYQELADYSILGKFIDSLAFEIRDYVAGGFVEERVALPLSDGRIRFSGFERIWHTREDAGVSGNELDSLDLYYRYGAVQYTFGVRTDGGS